MDDQAVTYRSLSTQAIAGVVLGVISLAAFFSPLLWPLPWCAAFVSWRAGHDVVKNPEIRTGAGLAAVGLFLGILIGVATIAKSRVADTLHQADADLLANEFFGRIGRGDLAGAYELTRPFPGRLPEPEQAALFYESNASAAEGLKTFGKLPAVGLLQGKGTPELREQFPSHDARFGKVELGRIYGAPTPHGEKSIVMILERSSPLRNPPCWRVKEVRLGGKEH